MKNEILEELWVSKDEVSLQYNNDIETIVKKLVEKEKKEKVVIDLSHIEKNAA